MEGKVTMKMNARSDSRVLRSYSGRVELVTEDGRLTRLEYSIKLPNPEMIAELSEVSFCKDQDPEKNSGMRLYEPISLDSHTELELKKEIGRRLCDLLSRLIEKSVMNCDEMPSEVPAIFANNLKKSFNLDSERVAYEKTLRLNNILFKKSR